MNLLDPEELAARFVLDSASPKILINWAIDLVLKEDEHDSIAIVAGYSETEAQNDAAEFSNDFKRVLSDLDIELPSEQEARIKLPTYICKSIIAGDTSPDQGHTELYELWRDSNYDDKLTYQKDLEGFMYLSDSLGLVCTGEEPLLDRFEGLTEDSYTSFLIDELII